MNKIRWGIVGTGNIANSFARDFNYVKEGELIAVASRSLDKAKWFAQKHKIPMSYGSYKELYMDQDLDVIYIATPHSSHIENTTDALKAGKAVLCEKPITLNPNELLQLMDLSKSTGKYLMEAMWTYFLPPILQAQKWISDGEIGIVRHIRAEFGFKGNIDLEPRLFSKKAGGGALLDVGIYPIALAWLIYKEIPKKSSVFHKKYHDVDREETVIFEYSNGEIANLSASITYDMPNEAVIIGDKGYIRIPEFFVAKECLLYKNEKLHDHFKDDRKSVGYNFEIEAVNRDLRAGKVQSDIVPLSTSLILQELMELVKHDF